MLTADMLGLLALLGAVSALDPYLTFHYVKYPGVFRRSEAACQICYGEFDCLSTECGYNAEAAELLKEDDGMNIVNDALTSTVDSMMYDLVLEDSMKEYNECIPLISSYTTCNKDNICLGCTTCDCDETGQWNCTDTPKCSATLLNIDRQVLSSVIEELKSASRYKRSFEVLEETSTKNFFEEIAGWNYASKPMNTLKKYNEDSTTTAPTTKSLRSLNDETNLGFDDILSNDNLDQWIKSAEKDGNENKHENTDTRQFLQILKNIEEGTDVSVPIDHPVRNRQLLKDLRKYLKDNSNGNESGNSSNDQPNSINSIMTEDIDLEKQHDCSSYTNSVATIVKRNARDINETTTKNETIIRNETSTFINETAKRIKHRKNNSSDSYPEKELQHLVDVVNVLIKNERKEIYHLNYVKDNLQKFSRKYKNYSNPNDFEHAKHNIADNSSKHVNWKIDMRNFYMNNLKKDVKDTIRDIYAIQKLKNLGDATGCIKKLKPLLFALTSYYLNNSRHDCTSKFNNISSAPALIYSSDTRTTDLESMPQRRFFESSKQFYKIKLIKRALTRMLFMIDNDSPSESILRSLKPKTMNILKRIVVKLHTPQIHPPIRDPNFNLTEILTTLEDDWQHAPVDAHQLYKPNPADRLHNLKLLHLTLSQGIDKLKNALISIQFGHSRRMNFIEEQVGKDLVSGAFKHLSNIDKRIKSLALYADMSNVTPKSIKKQKDSMWVHIKNAFSNSKTGLMKYIQNKFHKPKSFIVNDMVRKRLEEVNKQKFLEVMKRWQDNFDNYRGRQKRAVKHYAKRMKNIVPKYLREIKRNNKVNLPLDLNSIKHSGTLNNKVQTNKIKYSKTMKDKVHTDGNNYSKTRNDRVLANGNKNVKIKNNNVVHAEGNVKKIYSGLKNKLNPALHVYKNHAKGNNKTAIGAKLGKKIGYSTSTSKRGVRTQGYH